MRSVNLRLSEQVIEQLKARADAEQRSVSNMAAVLVVRGLDELAAADAAAVAAEQLAARDAYNLDV